MWLIVDITNQYHGSPKPFVEHVHSPDVITFIKLAKLIGSTSHSSRTANDARLLGGGLKMPRIVDQMEEYWTFCRK